MSAFVVSYNHRVLHLINLTNLNTQERRKERVSKSIHWFIVQIYTIDDSGPGPNSDGRSTIT